MIITQTPLRISLFGGNTDFPEFFQKYGGCVLTTAINKYIYCIVKERFDDKICIGYSRKETVDQIDQIKHELVREALRKVGVKKGIEINFIGDIPSEGSGLGSSSSVTVGVLNALYHYVGYTPSAEQLAKEAVEIEIKRLKKPIGIQDQYIAAFGGLRFLTFQKNGKVDSEIINLQNGVLDDLDNSLMLFYTKRIRKSDQILRNIKSGLSHNSKTLLEIKKLAMTGKKTLEKGKIEELGNMLNKYWLLKKSLFGQISDSTIDEMYESALKAGATGGKITGAGGGGFMVLMVASKNRSSVRQALHAYNEVPFRLERDGSKVIFDVRRY